MANTYYWYVQSLECYPESGGQQNVIFKIYWQLDGTDGPNSGTIYGDVNTTYTAGGPFTPYNQLTQDQVIGWVKEALGPEGIAEAQANVDAQIAAAANPPVVSPPLPW